MAESRCSRCGAPIDNPTWSCWLCGEGLCNDCGDRHGHCDHEDPPLDEIDRLWATADEAKRVELLEMVRELAAKYRPRGPAMLPPPKAEKLN
jgi:predicted amidophosphoribosyltransferase